MKKDFFNALITVILAAVIIAVLWGMAALAPPARASYALLVHALHSTRPVTVGVSIAVLVTLVLWPFFAKK